MSAVMNPKMGKKATDRITGFSGTITGFAQYITGCNQFLVQPAVDKESKFVDARWIDEDRLEIDPSTAVTLGEISAPGPDIAAPVR